MAEAVQKISSSHERLSSLRDMFSWDTSFLSLLPSTFSKQLRKASSLQSVGSLDSTTMKTLGAFSLSQGTMKIPDGWADATLLNDTNGLNVVGDTIKAEVMNAISWCFARMLFWNVFLMAEVWIKIPKGLEAE